MRVYVFSLFCPFLLGAITKTDVGPLFSILAIVVVVTYSEPLRKDMIFVALTGAFGIFLAYFLNTNISPFKPLYQFFAIFFVLTSFGALERYLEDLCRLSLVLIRLLAFTYVLSVLIPPLSNLLSSILFVNRFSISLLVRSSTGFLGEPSFAAIIFSGFVLILLIVKQKIPELTSKKSFCFDLLLSISACIFTRSFTSIAILLMLFIPFLLFPFIRGLSKLRLPKKTKYLVVPIISIAALPVFFRYLPQASIRSLSLISNFRNDGVVDAFLADTSIAQRLLNINVFLTNFPLSVDFLFGSTLTEYARVALDTASKLSFNYNSLFISSHPFYAAQVSAYPVLYFSVGLIPAVAYATLLYLYITSFRIKLLSSPYSISALLYLITSLFSGPSLLFPMPIFVIFLIYSLEAKINAAHKTFADAR